MCEAFSRLGYCANGDRCEARHELVCAHFGERVEPCATMCDACCGPVRDSPPVDVTAQARAVFEDVMARPDKCRGQLRQHSDMLLDFLVRERYLLERVRMNPRDHFYDMYYGMSRRAERVLTQGATVVMP